MSKHPCPRGTTKDENGLDTPTPPLPPPRGRVRVGGDSSNCVLNRSDPVRNVVLLSQWSILFWFFSRCAIYSLRYPDLKLVGFDSNHFPITPYGDRYTLASMFINRLCDSPLQRQSFWAHPLNYQSGFADFILHLFSRSSIIV